jgi:hypothetical protein
MSAGGKFSGGALAAVVACVCALPAACATPAAPPDAARQQRTEAKQEQLQQLESRGQRNDDRPVSAQ